VEYFRGAAYKNRHMHELSAGLLLQRVASCYAGARTYRDTGDVYTTVSGPGGTRFNHVSFATAFSRADRKFRFEFVVPYPVVPPLGYSDRRWIIFRDGSRIDQWSFLGAKAAIPETFGLLIASAIGISRGAAHHVPALLMPRDVTGRRVTDHPYPARVLEQHNFAHRSCLRVAVRLGPEDDGFGFVIWIDSEELLIRRLDARCRRGALVIKSITTYNPLMDTSIPQQELEFSPPAWPVSSTRGELQLL
jgi:hypothetical protein